MNKYLMATRPRSWPAMSCCTIVAACYIYNRYSYFSLLYSLLCVGVTFFSQIGLNLINDYQEGMRGVDRHKNDGHLLVSKSKEFAPTILIIAIIAFILQGICGLILIIDSGKYILLIVGILSYICAIFYTGGKKPYGYSALGEVPSFFMTGIVAFCGTLYVQNIHIDIYAVMFSCIFGLFSNSVLMNDNIRDIPFDPKFGKKTLAVILGEKRSKILYNIYTVIIYVLLFFISLKIHTIIICFLMLIPHIYLMKKLWNAKGPELLKTLDLTGIFELLFSILCVIGLLI